MRRRLVRECEQRRGPRIDPARAHRTLLLRGYETLSESGQDRLAWVLPPTTPEQLRRLLTSANVDMARTEKMILGCYVLGADIEESWRLWTTIEAWWPAMEVLITHRVTMRVPRPQTPASNIKRTGRGLPKSGALPSPYPAYQRCPTRGVNPLTQQGTTLNCE